MTKRVLRLCIAACSCSAIVLMYGVTQSQRASAWLHPLETIAEKQRGETVAAFMSWTDAFSHVGELAVPIGLAHSKGMVLRSSWAVLLDTRGQVFMQQRSMAMRTCPGSFTVGIGESCHVGESNRQCVIRGVAEEIGVIVDDPAHLEDIRWELELPDGRMQRALLSMFCVYSSLNSTISIDAQEITGWTFDTPPVAWGKLADNTLWCNEGYRVYMSKAMRAVANCTKKLQSR